MAMPTPACCTSAHVHWTRESEISLLQLVRERSLLWDPRHPLYPKTSLRKAQYGEVAENLRRNFPLLKDLDAEGTRKKFNNLKTYLKKVKLAPGGPEGRASVRWELYEYAAYLGDVPQDLEAHPTWTLPPQADVGCFPSITQAESPCTPEQPSTTVEPCEDNLWEESKDFMTEDIKPPITTSETVTASPNQVLNRLCNMQSPLNTSSSPSTPHTLPVTTLVTSRQRKRDHTYMDLLATGRGSTGGFARGLAQIVEDAVSDVPRHKRCRLAIQILDLIEKASYEN